MADLICVHCGSPDIEPTQYINSGDGEVKIEEYICSRCGKQTEAYFSLTKCFAKDVDNLTMVD